MFLTILKVFCTTLIKRFNSSEKVFCTYFIKRFNSSERVFSTMRKFSLQF